MVRSSVKHTRALAVEQCLDFAALRLRSTLLELKYTLTQNSPFDFLKTSSVGPVLLVGEGNLSFAYSLASRIGSAHRCITATTFEAARDLSSQAIRNAQALQSIGVTIRHAIDAKTLDRKFPVSRFRLVIFQFPNVASRSPLYHRNPNHVLVRCFLRSASNILLRNGEIAITVVDNPHYDGAFAMSEAARWAGLSEPDIHPFDLADHPGYSHTNTLDSEASAIDPHDRFQTFVFRRKD